MAHLPRRPLRGLYSRSPIPKPQPPTPGSAGLVGYAWPGAASRELRCGSRQDKAWCLSGARPPRSSQLLSAVSEAKEPPSGGTGRGSGPGLPPCPSGGWASLLRTRADWSKAYLLSPPWLPQKGVPSSGEEAQMFLVEWGLGIFGGCAASGPGVDSDLLSVARSWYCECWYQ